MSPLILALMAPAVAAAAPQPPIDDDVRCFTVMAFMASSTDAEVKQGGSYGAMLWYGRLSARLPAAEIPAAVKRESDRMDTDKTALQREAQRCGAEMAAYGKAMQTMGDALKGEAAK